MAHPSALRALRAVITKHNPDIVFLCELKTSETKFIAAILSSCSLTNHAFVPAIKKAGGICLAWKDSINLTITHTTPWFFNSTIISDTNSPPWCLTTLHCPSTSTLKTTFWNEIKLIHNNIVGAWLAIGDFNDIISQAEKKGGKPFASSSIHCFQSDLDALNLIDTGFIGNTFTWNNKRWGKANIQERLDRSVANESWLLTFPLATTTHLTAINSDHKPLLLETNPTITSGPKPFRFESMWMNEPSCKMIVQKAWSTHFSDSPLHKLIKKTSKTKCELRSWNKSYFGNVHDRISNTTQQIKETQEKDPTPANLQLDRTLQAELDSLLKKQGEFWKQRSRINWLQLGDANTRFFHLSTMFHRKYNRIRAIENPDGNLVHSWDDIGKAFGAMVVRNSSGNFCMAHTFRFLAHDSSTAAVHSLLLAMNIVKALKLEKLTFETSSLPVVEMILDTSAQVPWRMNPFVIDIYLLMKCESLH